MLPELQSTTEILRHSNPNENENSIYMPIYVVTSIFGLVFILGPLLVRAGPNKDIIRLCIMLAAFHMWLLWVTIYISQMHPVMEPRFKNTTLAWMMYKYGTGVPPPTTTTTTTTTEYPLTKPTEPDTTRPTTQKAATSKPTTPTTATTTTRSTTTTTTTTAPPTTKGSPRITGRTIFKSVREEKYKFFPTKRLTGPGKRAEFITNARTNAHIILSTREEAAPPMYEIILGAEFEHGCQIKKNGQTVFTDDDFELPIHPLGTHGRYWMEWEDGYVVVGFAGINTGLDDPWFLAVSDIFRRPAARKRIYEYPPFMLWDDINQLTINYIGFRCRHSACEWVVYFKE